MNKLGRIETRKVATGDLVETRRVRRAIVELQVRLRLRNADVAFHCTSVNISREGAYLGTCSLLPLGTALDIELRPEGGLLPLQLRGRVERHGAGDEKMGMAVTYEWASAEAAAFINRLIDDLAET